MKISEITQFLESIAPLSYQESYDNSGLLIGNSDTTVLGILVSLDITLSIVNEAISKNCNLIISHHPLIFKGLKKINGNTDQERCIISCIKNDIAIYAIHTNLDNVAGGVNFKIADKLGLKNVKILKPRTEVLSKLKVFVPNDFSKILKSALFEAGAGNIGNYIACSFEHQGMGSFTPNEGSNPFIGQLKQPESVEETAIEVVFPTHLTSRILKAMRDAHPYEEVAYYIQNLQNQNQSVGFGAVGELPAAMEAIDFLKLLKNTMNISVIRHTQLCHQSIIKVAVCGGVGGFLLNDAKASGAQIFITADYKYHEFFEAENQIIIADIGHYETEQFTKELLVEHLSKKFTNFASYLSEINTNPINYFT